MKFRLIAILLCTVLGLYSCSSGNHGDHENDSSVMMDSSIMNNPDTLDTGLDTSVIDTHIKSR